MLYCLQKAGKAGKAGKWRSTKKPNFSSLERGSHSWLFVSDWRNVHVGACNEMCSTFPLDFRGHELHQDQNTKKILKACGGPRPKPLKTKKLNAMP